MIRSKAPPEIFKNSFAEYVETTNGSVKTIIVFDKHTHAYMMCSNRSSSMKDRYYTILCSFIKRSVNLSSGFYQRSIVYDYSIQYFNLQNFGSDTRGYSLSFSWITPHVD